MNRKNRLAVWLCLVLTVLMVVSAIPAGAISVSVAGVTTPAETVSTPNSEYRNARNCQRLPRPILL